MRSSKKSVRLIMVMLSLALLLSACGGGGGSSSGSGGGPQLSALVVADKVSVVSAASTSSGKPALKGLLLGLIGLGAPPADSTYYKDRTDVWVSERSAESFNTINDILCMIGQTRYDAMLNAGNYIALVDRNQCSSDSNASSAGQGAQNQSSGADMPNYMSFTVNSSRASETSSEIVKVWIHQPASNHDNEMLIYAYLTIDEGKSDTNPYGIFSISFKGFPIIGGVPTGPATLKGTLKAERQDPADLASRVLLKFVGTDGGGGGGTGLTQITLDRQPDGSAGAGVILQTGLYSGVSQTTNFNLAFDSANFYREDLISAGSPTVCLDRGAYSESAWSYALYDANGERVVRNSGFPITFGTNGRGWVGYWGLWAENNAVLNDGDTVNKVDYNNGSAISTPYTVFKSGGKLKKHTKKLLTLNDIKNIPLNYNEQVSSGPSSTNYQVVWDGSFFKKVAEMPQNCNGNCTWADIQQPYPTINVQNLSWGNLNFWSQSLGGQAQVPLSNCTYSYSGMGPGVTSCDDPTNATPVVFYAEDLVYPGDATVPAGLTCYDQCPKADSNGVNPNDPFVGNMMSGPTVTPTVYTYVGNAMVLRFGGFDVISATSTTNMSTQWGVMSGALFEPTQTNLDLLDCNWDGNNDPASNPQICGWKAWSVLPVFYTWETGPNNWNRFIGLKDGSNNFVTFEPPLQVKYVHHQTDAGEPDFKYNNVSFMMEYAGFGQLNGIPGKCVNMDTGADANCADSQNSQAIRWVPVFTIPSVQTVDSSLTLVTDPADNQLYVKPLHIEQRMKAAADPGACFAIAATDFAVYEPLPDLAIWSDPQTADGPKPVVDAAPAVIGGIIQ